MFDLGYLTIKWISQEQMSSTPSEERQQHLSQQEKEYNKNQSKKRIVQNILYLSIENYRILTDVFRNKLKNYNKVSDIDTGLLIDKIMNLHL